MANLVKLPTDIKQETPTSPSKPEGRKAAPAPSVQSVGTPDIEAKKKKRTVGNIAYDVGLYGTVVWGGVSLVSLATAHEAIHGTNKYFDWLRSMRKGLSAGVSKVLSSTVMRHSPKEDVEAWASGTALYYMLGFGGSSLSGITKYMEDNRLKLAGKIDNLLGTQPPDPELIAKEPKQTWLSVLSGRVLSVIGIGYGTFVLLGPKKVDKISKWCGGHAADLWMKIKPKSNPETVRKWSDMAAFDVLFTAITASVTYAFSRFVAKKQGGELNLQQDSDEKNTPAAPSQTPGLSAPAETPAPTTKFQDRAPAKPRETITQKPRTGFADAALLSNAGEHMQLT